MTWKRVITALWVILGIGLLIAGETLTPRAQAQSQGVMWFNRCQVATPSDTVDFPIFTQTGVLPGMVYIGGTGNMVGVAQDQTTTLFSGIPAGSQLPIGIRRINSTNTTATTIVACWRF